MKIELIGGWSMECEVKIQFKGKTLDGYWSTDEGYKVLWSYSNFTDDEREELEMLLQEADTPVIRFKNSTYETEVE